MNLNHYQREAQRTARIDWTKSQRLTMSALGAAGEAGEYADHVKKIMFHGHSVDRERMLLELGDILWYIAEGAAALDYTLEEVAEANISKLKTRYPDGFDSERSKNRGDK